MKRFRLETASLFGILSILAIVRMATAEGNVDWNQDIAVRFFNRDTYHLSQAFRAYIPATDSSPEQAENKVNELHKFFALLVANRSSLAADLKNNEIRLSQEDLQAAVKNAQAIAGMPSSSSFGIVSAAAPPTGAQPSPTISEHSIHAAELIADISTEGGIFDGGPVANAAADPVPQSGGNATAPKDIPYIEHYRIIYARSFLAPGNEFAVRVPAAPLRVPLLKKINGAYVEFDVPRLTKMQAATKRIVLQSQQVGNNGLGTTEYQQLVDWDPGWRGYSLVGAGWEKTFKRFVAFAQTNIGVSKDTTRDGILDQIVTNSLGGQTSIVQSRVDPNYNLPVVNKTKFFSTATTGGIINIKPWIGILAQYTRILSGGPTNGSLTLLANPNDVIKQSAFRNTFQVGVSLNLDRLKDRK